MIKWRRRRTRKRRG